ncbi:hypothetical protein HK100_005333 [Physocladia obscura]|uniref:ABC transporter domain-containing protein n=1 Tax=Physocladia obscura TaxID=109957 RepID=A0AAD5XGG7_9FUNG|nr:hypothetical protein HK100_005333 [Physocladia obscura]
MSDSDTEKKETAVTANRDLKVKSSYASGAVLVDAQGKLVAGIAEAIAATGTLLSPPNSRDVQVERFTLQAYGKLLVKDSDLTFLTGRRYGLVAPNGSGKSTILHAIACGLVPTPAALDYYLLDREYVATELTALEAVLDITEQERGALLDEMEALLDATAGPDADAAATRLDAVHARLADLEVSGEARAAEEILRGLGFDSTRIATKTKDLSGGWRMRIALARILFVKPSLMLLDEPTNHLDLEAVVWLEEYLVHNLAGHTLVITCHSQDTLNEVCTDIVHLNHQKLDYYKGDYSTFVRVRAEKTALLTKQAIKEEKKMAKVAENLTKTGTAAQTQAKQKLKNMDKEKEKNMAKNKDLQEELIIDRDLSIRFGECGRGLPPPVLKFNDVDFGYDADKPPMFKGLNFGLDLDSRIALVGPNGAGKSTILKLMLGKLEPTGGSISRHHNLRIGQFNQHMGDQLDMERSAVEWLCLHFKHIKPQDMRREVGKFGLTGKSQVVPMKQLSDGQRRRVLFCYLGLHTPHMFLMDEPTNALDLETIDALAEAINEYDGGVIFVTHDFRLIDQVAKEIWIVQDGKMQVFDGDIHDYKAALKAKYAKDREDAAVAASLAAAEARKAKSQAAATAPDGAGVGDQATTAPIKAGGKKKGKKVGGGAGPAVVQAVTIVEQDLPADLKKEEHEELVVVEETVEAVKVDREVEEAEEEDDAPKKKKKSKKSSKKSKHDDDYDDGDENVNHEADEEDEETHTKKSKSKKSKSKSKDHAEVVATENGNEDENDESSERKKSKSLKKSKSKEVDNDDDESPKKSKSKKSKEIDPGFDGEQHNADDNETARKKSKSKKSKSKEGDDEDDEAIAAAAAAAAAAGDGEDDGEAVEKQKKSKKSKSKDVDEFDASNDQDHTESGRKKLKSKKSKSKEIDEEEVFIEEGEDFEEVPAKKSKSKKSKSSKSDNVDDDSTKNNQENKDDEESASAAKKSKKSSKKDLLDENNNDENNASVLAAATEKKSKKSKKLKDVEIGDDDNEEAEEASKKSKSKSKHHTSADNQGDDNDAAVVNDVDNEGGGEKLKSKSKSKKSKAIDGNTAEEAAEVEVVAESSKKGKQKSAK